MINLYDVSVIIHRKGTWIERSSSCLKESPPLLLLLLTLSISPRFHYHHHHYKSSQEENVIGRCFFINSIAISHLCNSLSFSTTGQGFFSPYNLQLFAGSSKCSFCFPSSSVSIGNLFQQFWRGRTSTTIILQFMNITTTKRLLLHHFLRCWWVYKMQKR